MHPRTMLRRASLPLAIAVGDGIFAYVGKDPDGHYKPFEFEKEIRKHPVRLQGIGLAEKGGHRHTGVASGASHQPLGTRTSFRPSWLMSPIPRP